jgi:hypothetical protein
VGSCGPLSDFLVQLSAARLDVQQIRNEAVPEQRDLIEVFF